MAGDPTDGTKYHQELDAEARLLARLDHPNICKVSDFFEDGGLAFIVMEYIAGTTLAELLESHRPSERQCLLWTLEITRALEYLHSQSPSVIVRDLNPKNVMLSTLGSVKLIDFGIAKSMDRDERTRTIVRNVGTPGYAPIEVYESGGTDERSDVYSLGATLLTLVTGEVPPEAIARLSRRMPLPDLTGLSDRSRGFILSCLAILPEERLSSAKEARSLIESALSGLSRSESTESPSSDQPQYQSVLESSISPYREMPRGGEKISAGGRPQKGSGVEPAPTVASLPVTQLVVEEAARLCQRCQEAVATPPSLLCLECQKALPNRTTRSDSVRLYRPFQIVLGSIFGSPVAGSLLILINARRTRKLGSRIFPIALGPVLYIVTVILSIVISTSPIAVAHNLDPDHVWWSMYLLSIIAMGMIAEMVGGREYQEHINSGGGAASSLSAIGIGLLFPALLVGVSYLRFITHS
jgi:serine/threonine protein kinase